MTLVTGKPETDVGASFGATAEAQAAHDATKRKKKNSNVPVGAPKESHAREVLTTLRTRLQSQVDGDDHHDSPELRAIWDSARQRLDQVNVALARLDEGKYGVCDNCLRPIEADRLVIRPFATLCAGCQNRIDGN